MEEACLRVVTVPSLIGGGMSARRYCTHHGSREGCLRVVTVHTLVRVGYSARRYCTTLMRVGTLRVVTVPP